ncbi:MAG TPA: FxsA family protein [Arcobacter sp.]|jgi:UPF0716 family protein affecting phage T7 exclusion|nr:FxsA family protein [Arcobacter sp.]
MIYIFLYLFLEVMVSTFFSSILGGLLTFIEIVLSAFIGFTILKSFKYSINDNIRDLTSGNITQDEFMEKNMNKALGAIMLIVPGFFTDILGVFFLFGIFTFVLNKLFSFKPKNENSQNSYNNTRYTHYTYTNRYNTQNTNNQRRDKDEDIIDVEVVDNNYSIKH